MCIDHPDMLDGVCYLLMKLSNFEERYNILVLWQVRVFWIWNSQHQKQNLNFFACGSLFVGKQLGVMYVVVILLTEWFVWCSWCLNLSFCWFAEGWFWRYRKEELNHWSVLILMHYLVSMIVFLLLLNYHGLNKIIILIPMCLDDRRDVISAILFFQGCNIHTSLFLLIKVLKTVWYHKVWLSTIVISNTMHFGTGFSSLLKMSLLGH